MEVQCHIQKGSPIIPILSLMNPITHIDTYLIEVLVILSSHLRVGLPKGLFPVGLSVKILKELLHNPKNSPNWPSGQWISLQTTGLWILFPTL